MGDLTERYAPHARDVSRSLLGKPNRDFNNADDWRYRPNGSLCVHVAGDRAGRFKDFGSGEEGDLVDLVMREKNYSIAEARK